MFAFSGKSFSLLFPEMLKTILEKGNPVSPRYHPTLEISPLIVQLEDPHCRFVDSSLINYPLTVTKQVQWLAGIVDIETLKQFDPQITRLVNPLTGLYDGAYGPIIRPQLDIIYTLLQKDPDTRRGVISVFQETDHQNGVAVPTTLSLQFMLRDDKLNMIVYMRSNDVLKGLPTDVHLFAFLQEVMATWLEVKVGSYTHIAGSGHIYKSAIDEAKLLLHAEVPEFSAPSYLASFEKTPAMIRSFLDWELSLSLHSAIENFKEQDFALDPYLRWGAEQICSHYKT